MVEGAMEFIERQSSVDGVPAGAKLKSRSRCTDEKFMGIKGVVEQHRLSY